MTRSLVRSRSSADGERLDFEPDLSDTRLSVTRARTDGFTIDATDRQVIIDKIDALQRQRIEVVLVELPMPQRFRDLLPDPGTDSDLVSATIAEIATEVGLIAMPRALNDLDFVDYSHVNPAGAASVTAWVADGLDVLASLDAGRCAGLGLVDDFGFAVPVDVCAPPDAPD